MHHLTLVQLVLASMSAAIVCFFTAMTGSGSGLILVPLLTFLGLSPVEAIAIHKFESSLWTATSAIRYWRGKQVHTTDLGWYLLIGSIGTFLGVRLIHLISDEVLQQVVGIAIIIVGLWTLFAKRSSVPKSVSLSKRIALMISMLGFGLYEGTFGSGNGYFIAALFFTVLGTNELKTIGMITVLAAVWNLVAVYEHFTLHSLILEYAIPLGIGSSLGAWFGAGFAIKQGTQFVRMIIIIGSFVAGIAMLIATFKP